MCTPASRAFALTPTAQAVETVAFRLSPLIAALDDLGAEHTPEERDAITRYLRRAVQVMRQYEKAGTT